MSTWMKGMFVLVFVGGEGVDGLGRTLAEWTRYLEARIMNEGARFLPLEEMNHSESSERYLGLKTVPGRKIVTIIGAETCIVPLFISTPQILDFLSSHSEERSLSLL